LALFFFDGFPYFSYMQNFAIIKHHVLYFQKNLKEQFSGI
jgi:hypothetical protein